MEMVGMEREKFRMEMRVSHLEEMVDCESDDRCWVTLSVSS
jgi:hypothetical protein